MLELSETRTQSHGVGAERAGIIEAFGVTQRQARFLVLVMIHSGVFMGRQYAAFAGITHGQKVHDFVERLLARGLATALRLGSSGRTRIFHVHHKPMYAAIGEPNNRHRKPVAIGRAVERMMLLDAVLAEPGLRWLGTERDKQRHFFMSLRERLRPADYPRVVFGKAPDETIRYFPDKLPIGVDPDGRRHVFLYSAAGRTPMDFRLFLLRHAELLSALGYWTIRVLFPRHLAGTQRAFAAAAYEHLTRPLQTSFAEELRESFRRRRAAGGEDKRDSGPSIVDARSLRAPAFIALYRRWLEAGDTAIWMARSPVLRDGLERGDCRVECVVLPFAYAHLVKVAGTS